MSNKWKLLTGPPLTKEQNDQFRAIMRAVQERRMGRVEGVLKMAKLAEEWGLPIPDEELPPSQPS